MLFKKYIQMNYFRLRHYTVLLEITHVLLGKHRSPGRRVCCNCVMQGTLSLSFDDVSPMLWQQGHQETLVEKDFFALLFVVLILMTVLLGKTLPEQRAYRDLMFTFTYYLYYVLITSVFLCFELQNQISHTGA